MTHRARAPHILLACAVALTGGAVQLHAQESSPTTWNAPRALDLVARARDRRSSAVVDTAFRSYQADARGYVYFFFDRPDTDERTLVKADQIALQVFWEAPNHTRQRIVGLRDKKVLPTNIHYHLDHLTVVQDDFGDRIRIGDGDEVSEVVHPLAPGADRVYDYRLADSLSLRYGGGTQEVRVYEVRVRPRDPDAPGFVGSVYLDQATASVVRMTFTFTPASYVDDYLDYIRISLDNSLWLGRYWLPYRQEVELRREIPELDFMAGSIIRGRFEIGPYHINPELSPVLFVGPRVTAAPASEREAFPFKQGLFDGLEKEGLAPTPSLEEIRAEARQVLAGRALSGLGPLRLHLGSFSDAVRFDRAEGLFLGGGINLRPSSAVQVRLSGGYAFGRERPSWRLSAVGEPASVVPELDLYQDEVRDMGEVAAASRVMGSLGTVVGGEDYTDPYLVRGASLTFRGSLPDEGPSVRLRWERHRSAPTVVDGADRPVRPVQEGILGAVDLQVPFAMSERVRGSVTGTLGRLGDHAFGRTVVRGIWALERPDRTWQIEASGTAGLATAGTPVQELFLLGGRGTIPGYPFRPWVGRGFWLARVEGTHPLLQPWVGIRLFAALGSTWLPAATAASLPAGWIAQSSDGLRASVGAGLALGWDVLRLDAAHGLRDGRWEIMLSVDPRFRPWL